MPLHYRAYRSSDREACLALFDANCPQYFSPLERNDYSQYLERQTGDYQLCVEGDRVLGAYGVNKGEDRRCTLNWILLAPAAQGRGLGRNIMGRVMEQAMAGEMSELLIAASHLSAPFFARFGARTVRTINDGWGPDMHRVDMRLDLV